MNPALSKFSRVDLCHQPTPLEAMHRLSEKLGGPNLWIKRDDCTGLATGGNKTRKLEFLVGDALQQGADMLVTQGAVQSNHVRQTAAAACKFGLDCHALLERRVPDLARVFPIRRDNPVRICKRQQLSDAHDLIAPHLASPAYPHPVATHRQPEIQVCAFCFHRWQDRYSHHVLSINLDLQAFQKADAWPQVVSVDGKDRLLKILIMLGSFTLHTLMMINQSQIVLECDTNFNL